MAVELIDVGPTAPPPPGIEQIGTPIDVVPDKGGPMSRRYGIDTATFATPTGTVTQSTPEVGTPLAPAPSYTAKGQMGEINDGKGAIIDANA